MALSLLIRRISRPSPVLSSITARTQHETLSKVAKALIPQGLNKLSPEQILELISERHASDAVQGRTFALHVANSLTTGELKSYSAQQVISLIWASQRGQELLFPSQRRMALSRIASLCTVSAVKTWSDADTVNVTLSLLRQKVPTRDCTALVKSCERIVEDKLFRLDPEAIISAAEVFSIVQRSERSQPRMLELVSEWARMETAHLSLEQKFKITAHCLHGGVFPAIYQELMMSFNIEDPRPHVRLTKEMLLKVEPSTLGAVCAVFIKQRRKVANIPLGDYLIQMYPFMEKYDAICILECCNFSEMLTAAQGKHIASLIRDDLDNFPKHLYNQLFRALFTGCHRCRDVMAKVQREVFDVAVEQTLDTHFGTMLLSHACSYRYDIADDVVARLVESSLNAEASPPLSQVARVLRSLGFWYGTSPPEGLLDATLARIDQSTVDTSNYADAVQCVRGLAELNHVHQEFLDQVALFFEEHMQTVVASTGGLECVSLLAVSLAKLLYMNRDLAAVLGDVVDLASEQKVNEYAVAVQDRSKPSGKDTREMLHGKRVRKVVPNLEVVRILGFCYLNKVYPMHASLSLSMLKPSDIKPFLKANVERGFVWALAPTLSAITHGKLRPMPIVQDRFFALSKHLWPCRGEFCDRVGDALLAFCSGDETCLRHSLLTVHGARVHFAMVFYSNARTPASWKQLHKDPATCNARQLQQQGYVSVAVMCVDSAVAEHNAVPVLSELQRLSLAISGFKLVIVDQAAWPEDSEQVQAHIGALLPKPAPSGAANETDAQPHL